MEKTNCITFDKAAQDSLPEEIKLKMKQDRASAELERDKQEIDALSHECMCRHWRFGTGKREWFDTSNPLSEYFKNRLFVHFGGFTPEISKRIGW